MSGSISDHQHKLFLLIIAALILLVGGYLRFENLRANPPWYPDEGDNLNVTRNLADGRLRYFALEGPPTLEGRPPLYHIAGVVAIRLWGDDLLSLRVVSAISGLLSIVLLLTVGSTVLGVPVAFCAAALLAFYPSAVIYNRYAFSYNLVAPIVVFNLYSLQTYFRTSSPRYLAFASLAVGLASVTDFVGIGLIGANIAMLLLSRKRQVIWATLLMIAPFLVYVGLMLSMNASAFLADVQFILFHGFDQESPMLRYLLFPLFYPPLFQWDWWMLPGIVGIFTLSKSQIRSHVLLMLAGILFMVLRVGSFTGLSFHRLIPIFPLIALGLASLLVVALPFLRRNLQSDTEWFIDQWPSAASLVRSHWTKSITVSLVIFLFILSPYVGNFVFDLVFLEGVYPTGLEQVTANSSVDGAAAAAFVNEHLQVGDVIIASPQVNWLIHGNVIDLKQSVAYQHLPPYPSDIDQRRWAFDPNYQKARFVVIDNFTRGFITGFIPSAKPIIQEVEQWPLAFQAGEYGVYENPAESR